MSSPPSRGRRALLRAFAGGTALGALGISSGCAYKHVSGVPYLPPLFTALHPDRPAVVRLFGSLHTGLARFYPLPDAVEAAYAASTRVAVELDARRHHAALRTAVAPMSTWPQGETLETGLAPELVNRLRDHYRHDPQEWQTVRHMKPWAVALSMVSADDATLAASGGEGIETHVMARARRDGRPVLELETAAEQAFAFAGGSLAEQEAVLALRMEQLRRHDNTFTRIVDAWRVGDERRLAELKLHAYPDTGVLAGNHRRIFTDRDRRMAERLDTLAQEPGDIFAMVGAFHLAGPDSMIERLTDLGWKVRRVAGPERPAPVFPGATASRGAGGQAG